MKTWIEPQPIQVPPTLQSAVGGHPLLAETLARRGLTDAAAALAFLDPGRYLPTPPAELPGAPEAAERLQRAIRQGKRICVWGDFDVDGQTATTILVSTLCDLAAGGNAAIHFHIPHRDRESHGVHLPVLERIIRAEGIDLVLTCDTGITAHDAAAYARSQGVEFLITDHHDPPPDLPAADVIVNPKLLPESHPLRELPGVGVAYKLAEALYAQAGRPDDTAQYLDLAALGIVADVAILSGDTRYLLQRGLAALRQTERLGLRALMESAELNPARLTEEHIGFALAPRLNSLGRLDDATVAVEFLTTEDLTRARILAAQMESLNAQRQLLCNQVLQAAEAQLRRDPSLLEEAALVLAGETWPAGVVGIVAGRLAERYGKPAILIAAPPNEPARGSARSVEGCDIHAAIAAAALQRGDLLHRFGGHPMAAGLSLDAERIPEFRRALSRAIREMYGRAEWPVSLQIDAYLPLADLSLDLVEQIERLAPFGAGNPPLTLASRNLVLQHCTPIGRTGEHLQAIVEEAETGVTHRVIWWQGGGASLPEGRFDLAYAARASDYRGQREVQVEWIDARPSAQPAARLQPARPSIAVVDYRQATDPSRLLAELQAQNGELQVWREGEQTVGGVDRRGLRPARALVIWTAPSGLAELRAAVERARPETIYLFGVDPDVDRWDKFTQRLAGLVKYALHSGGGVANIAALAAATAHREATVRAGLEWLAARGYIATLEENDGEVRLSPGDQAPRPELPQLTVRLQALLEETAAYRAYFRRAERAWLAQAWG